MADKSGEKKEGGVGSLWKGVKDFWIEPEKESKPEKAEQEVTPQKNETTAMPPASSTLTPKQNGNNTNPSIDLGADPEAVEVVEGGIFGIVDKMTSYEIFLDTFKKLEGVPMDESTRYKAALKTSGKLPEEILEGLKEHQARLLEQREIIESEFADKQTTHVTARQKELEALDAERTTTMTQLAELQTKLTEIGARKSILEQEVSSEQQKINAAKARAHAAVDTVKARLDAEQRKLEIYGKGV